MDLPVPATTPQLIAPDTWLVPNLAPIAPETWKHYAQNRCDRSRWIHRLPPV